MYNFNFFDIVGKVRYYIEKNFLKKVRFFKSFLFEDEMRKLK